ncbi:hypothetical protein Vadar_010876 [Vaccinium darrowii]|uniref:Uncharacterized protein n=1 Tax=Vaccinium darrowii TaxID=229202 RepID=A0ACB7X9H4_9ERIC|nr:hypothetical protein Vadar_010876 [Vaccinium darrowii]
MYMGADSSIKQNKQGITCGIAHGKSLKPGEKFIVIVPEELLRVVGHDAQAFITEEKFQLQDVHHVRNAVLQQLNRKYRAWRHRLYKVHFLPHKSVENAWQHQPPHLKPEDWEYLCRYFGSKEYTATGEMKDQVDLWHETHFSEKKKDWVDECSKELYDQMLELRGKSKEDGSSPMTDKEISLEVLKKRQGYVCGPGPGSKPSSFSRSKTSNVELEEARRRADEAESQARKLSEEVTMLKANQIEMVAKQEEMNRQKEETQALVPMMIGELCSRRITRYSSRSLRQFRFDSRWCKDPETYEVVRQGWKSTAKGSKMFEVFHKIKSCRQNLRSWSKQKGFNARRKINQLQERLELIRTGQCIVEPNQVCDLEKELGDAWIQEEAFWRQKSRADWMALGDRNTSFFHAKVNQRRKRNRITGIQRANGTWCEEPNGIAEEFVDYFQNLFQSEGTFNVEEVLCTIQGQVTDQMNVMLTKEVNRAEIQKALWDMNPTKAPGADEHFG